MLKGWAHYESMSSGTTNVKLEKRYLIIKLEAIASIQLEAIASI